MKQALIDIYWSTASKKSILKIPSYLRLHFNANKNSGKLWNVDKLIEESHPLSRANTTRIPTGTREAGAAGLGVEVQLRSTRRAAEERQERRGPWGCGVREGGAGRRVGRVWRGRGLGFGVWRCEGLKVRRGWGVEHDELWEATGKLCVRGTEAERERVRVIGLGFSKKTKNSKKKISGYRVPV